MLYFIEKSRKQDGAPRIRIYQFHSPVALIGDVISWQCNIYDECVALELQIDKCVAYRNRPLSFIDFCICLVESSPTFFIQSLCAII